MRFLSEISWRHSWEFDTQFPNNSDFFMSVSFLVGYFLTEIRQIQGYIHFEMRYIFKKFQRHSRDVCTLIQNNYEFLVCLSVFQFVTSLLKSDKYGDISGLCSSKFNKMPMEVRHCEIAKPQTQIKQMFGVSIIIAWIPYYYYFTLSLSLYYHLLSTFTEKKSFPSPL